MIDVKELTLPVGMVMISKDDFEQLLEDSMFLEALQSEGVDNWDGYDYAVETYNQMKEENGSD